MGTLKISLFLNQNLLFECISDISSEKMDLFELNGSPAAFVCQSLLETSVEAKVLFIGIIEARKKQILKFEPFLTLLQCLKIRK